MCAHEAWRATGNIVSISVYDLSKIFDNLNHGMLMDRFGAMGVRGTHGQGGGGEGGGCTPLRVKTKSPPLRQKNGYP